MAKSLRRHGVLCGVVAALLFCWFFGLGGCQRKKPNGQTTDDKVVTLRLGYRPGAMLDVTPLLIATKPDAGLKLELVPVSSPATGFARFHAGEVDALAGMTLEVLFAQSMGASKKLPFRVYAAQADTGDRWACIVARKGSGITNLKELAGKAVASLPTDQAEWILRNILIEAGVPTDAVKTTRYSMANPLAGLRSGEHVALFGPDPAIAQAIVEGHSVIARGVISRYLFKGRKAPVSGSLIRTTFLEQYPQAFRTFLSLVDEATQVVEKNPERVRELFAEERFGNLAAEVRSKLVFPLMTRPDREIREVTAELAQRLLQDGLLKNAVDVNMLFIE